MTNTNPDRGTSRILTLWRALASYFEDARACRFPLVVLPDEPGMPCHRRGPAVAPPAEIDLTDDDLLRALMA